MSAHTAPGRPLAEVLAPLVEQFSKGTVDLGASRFLRTPACEATVSRPTSASPSPADAGQDSVPPKESAVLILVVGTTLENAVLLIEERAHSMRSQPAQFALPGGRVDPSDASHRDAALRESLEEIGLDPRGIAAHAGLQVLGEFEPIHMPVRRMAVTPVVAWLASDASDILPTLTPSEAEVERIVPAPLVGPGSLTAPDVLSFARVRDQDVGIAFDLPIEPGTTADDAFVWGFTASLIGGFLTHTIPGFEGPSSPAVKQVPATRLRGERPGASAR